MCQGRGRGCADVSLYMFEKVAMGRCRRGRSGDMTWDVLMGAVSPEGQQPARGLMLGQRSREMVGAVEESKKHVGEAGRK